MSCVDENRLVWYLRGELTERGADDIAGHLDTCQSCRDLFALVASSSLLPAAPAEPNDAPDELVPGVRVGRYTITRAIGAGAMGVVYAAHDEQLDRAIALKLVRPAVDQDQLLREAQALARLSNPHVVGVFDVGTYGDRLFVAIELVDGETLDAWCREHRSAREIAAVFRQVADGLAAAHAAGVVHRDVKPGNICIGRDGRARVLDFGLAHRIALPGRAEIAGTPAYMSPEQLAGEPVDARADQFGFSVALYEALYGERPFAGLASAEMRLREPPRGSRVPAWLHRVVARGLAAEPADRFPDMRAVAAKLEPPRTRRYVAAGVALAATATIGLAIGRADAPQPCRGVVQHAWNEPRREVVHAGFVASGVAYAPAAWEGVDRKLSDYARDWIAMRTEACEACRVRGEQSQAVMDRRMACLDDRLRALDQLAALLVHPDAEAVEHAGDAAAALPAIARCADVRWLADAEPMTPEAEALATEQARIENLGALGKLDQAREAVERLVIAARKVGHRRMLGRVLSLAGMFQTQAGEFDRAQATLQESILAAEVGHDDDTRVEAWLAKANAADRVGRAADGLQALDQAAAILERIGEEPGLATELAYYRGALELDLGHFAAARAATLRCIELVEKYHGKDSTQLAEPLQVLGLIADAEGKHADAIPILERTLALKTRELGPAHPQIADALETLAVAHSQLYQTDAAIAEFRRALDIRERALGPRHRTVANLLASLAEALVVQGNYEDALPLVVRAQSILDGVDDPLFAAPVLLAASRVRRVLGDAKTALDDAVRAVAVRAGSVGTDHPQYAEALDQQGAALTALGRPAEAIELHRRALAILEHALGGDHPDLAETVVDLGEAYLADHRTADAVAVLERGLALRERGPAGAAELATVRFDLARALGGGPRAVALAEQARTGFAGHARELAAVRAWQSTHR